MAEVKRLSIPMSAPPRDNRVTLSIDVAPDGARTFFLDAPDVETMKELTPLMAVLVDRRPG